jgi:hypothetical protein
MQFSFLYIENHITINVGASGMIIANNEDFLFVMSGKKLLNSIKPILPVNSVTGVPAYLGNIDNDATEPLVFKEVFGVYTNIYMY